VFEGKCLARRLVAFEERMGSRVGRHVSSQHSLLFRENTVSP
jgi:hypothetical protein